MSRRYYCGVCEQGSTTLTVCSVCGTGALPCCLEGAGACGRMITRGGRDYVAHHWYVLEARRAWKERTA